MTKQSSSKTLLQGPPEARWSGVSAEQQSWPGVGGVQRAMGPQVGCRDTVRSWQWTL